MKIREREKTKCGIRCGIEYATKAFPMAKVHVFEDTDVDVFKSIAPVASASAPEASASASVASASAPVVSASAPVASASAPLASASAPVASPSTFTAPFSDESSEAPTPKKSAPKQPRLLYHLCGQTFTRADNFYRHLKVSHSESASSFLQ